MEFMFGTDSTNNWGGNFSPLTPIPKIEGLTLSHSRYIYYVSVDTHTRALLSVASLSGFIAT